MPKCNDCFHKDACIRMLVSAFSTVTREQIDDVVNKGCSCELFVHKDTVKILEVNECLQLV